MEKNAYIEVRGYKERKTIMKELSLNEQYAIQGGGLILTGLLYLLLGAGLYKIVTSKRGRISIPRLIHLEWGR